MSGEAEDVCRIGLGVIVVAGEGDLSEMLPGAQVNGHPANDAEASTAARVGSSWTLHEHCALQYPCTID